MENDNNKAIPLTEEEFDRMLVENWHKWTIRPTTAMIIIPPDIWDYYGGDEEKILAAYWRGEF